MPLAVVVRMIVFPEQLVLLNGPTAPTGWLTVKIEGEEVVLPHELATDTA